jgi:hypothetical protein
VPFGLALLAPVVPPFATPLDRALVLVERHVALDLLSREAAQVGEFASDGC